MTTITPTEERARLWIKNGRRHDNMVGSMARWLERAARRKGRHINEPSVVIEVYYDPPARLTFLYASADSFPDTLPSWLRTARPVATNILEGCDGK